MNNWSIQHWFKGIKYSLFTLISQQLTIVPIGCMLRRGVQKKVNNSREWQVLNMEAINPPSPSLGLFVLAQSQRTASQKNVHNDPRGHGKLSLHAWLQVKYCQLVGFSQSFCINFQRSVQKTVHIKKRALWQCQDVINSFYSSCNLAASQHVPLVKSTYSDWCNV